MSLENKYGFFNIRSTKTLVIMLLLLSACKETSDYTLYRNSLVDAMMRIHISSFDVKEKHPYNKENCLMVKDFFEKANKSLTIRYWCEKGKYNK